MGLLDNIKNMFGGSEKVSEMVDEHADEAIDKAAEFADEKTGGKHTDQIDAAAEKAKDLVDGMGDSSE